MVDRNNMDRTGDRSDFGRVRLDLVGSELRGLHLHHLAAELEELDVCNPHSVAWLVTNQTGRQLGKS
jgi:hypothetical protein